MFRKLLSVLLCACVLVAVCGAFANAEPNDRLWKKYYFGTDPDAEKIEGHIHDQDLIGECIYDGNGYIKLMLLKGFEESDLDEDFISKHFSEEEIKDIITEDEASDKDKEIKYGYKKYGFILDEAVSKGRCRDEKAHPIIKVKKFSEHLRPLGPQKFKIIYVFEARSDFKEVIASFSGPREAQPGEEVTVHVALKPEADKQKVVAVALGYMRGGSLAFCEIDKGGEGDLTFIMPDCDVEIEM